MQAIKSRAPLPSPGGLGHQGSSLDKERRQAGRRTAASGERMGHPSQRWPLPLPSPPSWRQQEQQPWLSQALRGRSERACVSTTSWPWLDPSLPRSREAKPNLSTLLRSLEMAPNTTIPEKNTRGLPLFLQVSCPKSVQIM